MANTVSISGMFGADHTYFADSPVVIQISELRWPESSPFNIVRVYVYYNHKAVGDFHADTGRQSSIGFDISSALRNIWSDRSLESELGLAENALTSDSAQYITRAYRPYSLEVYTEYLASDDGGVFTQTQCQDADGNTMIPGGRCLPGGLTEWERYNISSSEGADASYWEHTNLRYGDASIKPTESPERVGAKSITSYIDVSNTGIRTVFWPAKAVPGADSTEEHAPIVLRDTQEYVDFLFVNRRGAVETCSGLTKEAMQIEVNKTDYGLVERPAFKPSRSIFSLKQGDPRRSWDMSSGHVTREWAEWWAMEFLPAKKHWMRIGSQYVPVKIDAAKKSVSIYDRSKQQSPHVDFTVTMALEG